MRTKKPTILPIPVQSALRKLGHDIRDARRRRIPASVAAQRASISRTTLVKIGKGDTVTPDPPSEIASAAGELGNSAISDSGMMRKARKRTKSGHFTIIPSKT